MLLSTASFFVVVADTHPSGSVGNPSDRYAVSPVLSELCFGLTTCLAMEKR